MTQYYIAHSSSSGSQRKNHKYYARVDTGEKTWTGSKKYRYFYSADEYKAYLNSADGKNNRKVIYNKTEFADTANATDSYNDTVQKTKLRYTRDNKSDRKPTESERIAATETYNKKLSDNGRKTVDEQAKARRYNKNSKEYFNLVNETYELEKLKKSQAKKLTNIEKNRAANDETHARASAALKESKSTKAKVKRKLRKVKNAIKKTMTSVGEKSTEAGKNAVSDFAARYYVDSNGEIKRRDR